MKFINIATSALVSLAAAAPIEPRGVQTTCFNITDFKASCKPNKGGCRSVESYVSILKHVSRTDSPNSWSFKLVQEPSSETISCSGSISGVDRFPDSAGFHYCKNNENTVFQFQHFANIDQYRLQLSDVQTVGSTVAASKVWDQASFPIVKSGHGSYQTYSGPSEFSLPANP